MRLYNLDIIRDFPYVDDLIRYLEQIIDTYSIVSVELAGSYARGEQLNNASYSSDLELLIFFRGDLPESCKVEQVDVDLISFENRSKLDRTFFLFDFTRTSKLLFGKKSSIEFFSFSNVEAWSIDEIILWRLYAVAKARTLGVKTERGALQRNLDYLITFQMLKLGHYEPTMKQRRAYYAHELADAGTRELLYNPEARESATTEELLEVFVSSLPPTDSLFHEVTGKDKLRNFLRALRALSHGRVLSRRRLVAKLRSSITFHLPIKEAIGDVDAYFSTFDLRH